MVIRKQKFNGNNPFNNKVVVDFEKRTVVFKPMTQGSIITYWGMLFIKIYCFFLFLTIFIPLIAVCMPEDYFLRTIILLLYMYYFLLSLIISFLFSLKYFDKKWQSEVYPRFNANLSIKLRKLLFQKELKWKRFNDNAVVNKKIFVPNFGNVMLKYRVHGDFSNQIKRITIDYLFEDDPLKWFIVFEFKKKPVSGWLEIKYF